MRNPFSRDTSVLLTAVLTVMLGAPFTGAFAGSFGSSSSSRSSGSSMSFSTYRSSSSSVSGFGSSSRSSASSSSSSSTGFGSSSRSTTPSSSGSSRGFGSSSRQATPATTTSQSGSASGFGSSSRSSASSSSSSSTGFGSSSRSTMTTAPYSNIPDAGKLASGNVAPKGPSKTALSKSSAFSAMDTRVKDQNAKKALEAYEAKVAQLKAPAVSPRQSYERRRSDPFLSDLGQHRSGYNYDGYMNRRSGYFQRYPEPVYVQHVYHSYPSSFGFWDTMVLLSLLDNRNNDDFWYHHRNDPDIQQFMTQSRENAELREQLARIDERTKAMQGQNVATNAQYVPPQVAEAGGAEVMVAPAVVAEATRPELRLCTGHARGNYTAWGNNLRNGLAQSIDVQIVLTEGSVDNLGRLQSNQCDAAVVQRDAYIDFSESHPSVGAADFIRVDPPIAHEGVHLLCSKESGITDIKQLNPEKHVVVTGKDGSGSASTWKEYARIDAGTYGKLPVWQLTEDVGIQAVVNGQQYQDKPATCMVYVASKHTLFLDNAIRQYGRQIALVPAWDDRLKERFDPDLGTMYVAAYFGKGEYGAIQNGHVNTALVYTDLVFGTKWKAQNPQMTDAVINFAQQGK